MHLYCQTDQAILLLAVAIGEERILRIPFASAQPPGHKFLVKPLVSITEQLIIEAQKILADEETTSFEIVNNYYDTIDLNSGMAEEVTTQNANLYIVKATIVKKPLSSYDWLSFPELLRSMPQDRSRLPYLRAFQVLAGGLEANTKVIDLKDLKKYLPHSS